MGFNKARVLVIIREALRTGTLPSINFSRCWVGYGTNKECTVCLQLIESTQVEYEVELPTQSAFVHLTCFTVWHTESTKPEDHEIKPC